MKVALLSPGFSAHERDWAIPALEDYVRRLGRVCELHVFALRWPPRRSVYRVYDATVHAMGGGHHLGHKVVAFWRAALAAIAAEHRRGRFDIVHAFWADEPGWLAAWLGPRLGAPVIVSLAGGELLGLRAIGYGLELLPGRRWLVRWTLRRATQVTAGSEYLAALTRRRLGPQGSGKLLRAPLGVELDRFAPGPRNDRRGPVLAVGSLSPVKNHAAVLNALARLPADVGLRVAGDGPLKPVLMEQAGRLGIADRVQWMDAVPHDEMPALYQHGSILVQASWHEAQGLAVLEAAACGVPAVGTAVGVLPEVGIVAGACALADAIEPLLADRALRARWGRQARERVEQDFSAAVCVERFLDLYRRCARPLSRARGERRGEGDIS